MLKEEFEQLAGCKVDAEVYEKVIEFTYMAFESLSKQEIAAMYVATDNETNALFEEGYALARELEILYKAGYEMRLAGLMKSEYDVVAYCRAKEKAYEAKVHAANLQQGQRGRARSKNFSRKK